MTRQDLYEFARLHKLAVLATVSHLQAPEAALVGIAVTSELELVFNTIESSRKCQNLRRNPKVAFVIGWEGEVTLQYEGQADEPAGNDLDRCKTVYFEAFPDGHERERWPGITYFRVRPTWARYSDYSKQPPEIVELFLSD
jgi:general stress protein 26